MRVSPRRASRGLNRASRRLRCLDARRGEERSRKLRLDDDFDAQADSSLSRPFRANGNYYCATTRRGGTSPVCEAPVDRCEGSIAKLSRSAGAPWPATAELVRLHEAPPAPPAVPTTALPTTAAALVVAAANWTVMVRE